MDKILESMKQPLMVIGALVILASLSSAANFMGIGVDPEKWQAGLIVGFIFIAISLYRNR